MDASKEWRDIAGYEGLYKVSEDGEIWSLRKNRLLCPQCQINGYLNINLTDSNGAHRLHRVHRIVADAFVDNPFNYPEVNHKDESKTNNKASNLEWCDRTYNNRYGTAKIRAAITQGKPVNQIYNGQVIATWKTQGLAALCLGLNQSGISMCCRGKCISHGGFRWEYAEN